MRYSLNISSQAIGVNFAYTTRHVHTYYTSLTLKTNLGSITEISNQQGQLVQRMTYDAWGNRSLLTDNTGTNHFFLDRGYTGNEHLDEFGLINMNGRMYDPLLGRMLSPDNYVQNSTNAQGFNRYSYCLNNPLVYTDPSGDIVWMPIIIGAAIGGYFGWRIGEAQGAEGLEMAGYIGGGALIGGLSGITAAGIAASGGGSMLAGTGAGIIGGAGFNGLSTGWNGDAMLDGAINGGAAGFVGGAIGGAIGGGWGALLGGATSNLSSQLLYNHGDFNNINWGSVVTSGATSFGIYHATSFYNWQWGGGKEFGDVTLKYNAYNKLNALYSSSRTFGRERGAWITQDGNFVRFKGAVYGKDFINMANVKTCDGAKYFVHTHWQSANVNYRVGNNFYEYDPYKPSYATDGNGNYFGDVAYAMKLGLDGMILTNKSLVYFNQDAYYSNQWDYPLFRYLPLFFWQ